MRVRLRSQSEAPTLCSWTVVTCTRMACIESDSSVVCMGVGLPLSDCTKRFTLHPLADKKRKTNNAPIYK